MKYTPTLQYKFFPSSSKIANHGPGVKVDMLTDPSFKLTDRDATVFYQAEWMNKSVAQVNVKSTYVLLQAPLILPIQEVFPCLQVRNSTG